MLISDDVGDGDEDNDGGDIIGNTYSKLRIRSVYYYVFWMSDILVTFRPPNRNRIS